MSNFTARKCLCLPTKIMRGKYFRLVGRFKGGMSGSSPRQALNSQSRRQKKDVGRSKPKKYLMISHDVMEDKQFKTLPESAKTLFFYLCKARNRYGDTNDDMSFWRTDQQLIMDTGFSRNQLKRSRKSLVESKFIWWASYLGEGKRLGPRYVILDTIYFSDERPKWTP